LSFPHHSTFSNDLITIADSFNLELSFSTRYLNLDSRSNLVINLMFLQNRLTELNTHFIHSDWCFFSDYASLSISIIIAEENIESFKFSIMRKLALSRMSYVLSKVLTSWTFPTLVNLKKSLILLHQELNLHKKTEHLEVWKIEKPSRVKLSLQSKSSLIPKFKRLLTKDKVSGNSWTGSTRKNFPLLKLSNTMINNDWRFVKYPSFHFQYSF